MRMVRKSVGFPILVNQKIEEFCKKVKAERRINYTFGDYVRRAVAEQIKRDEMEALGIENLKYKGEL